MITHIAFDMDGVIYSSEPYIADAYYEAIRRSKFELRMPSLAQITAQIGKPVHDIFQNVFPGITLEQEEVIKRETMNVIREMMMQGRGYVFDGVPAVVEALAKKTKLVVCSNGRRQYVETILKRYDLEKYFEPLKALDDLQLTHKGELLQHYVEWSGAPKTDWVMVGDRKADWDAAQYVGCRFIGCLWGHADPRELQGVEQLMKSPAELNTII